MLSILFENCEHLHCEVTFTSTLTQQWQHIYTVIYAHPRGWQSYYFRANASLQLLGAKEPEQQKGETEPTINTPSPSEQAQQSASAEQPQTTQPSEVQPLNPTTPPEKPPRPDCKPTITVEAAEDVDLNSDTDSVEDMETDSGVSFEDAPPAVSCGDVSNRAQAVPDTANAEWIPGLSVHSIYRLY